MDPFSAAPQSAVFPDIIFYSFHTYSSTSPPGPHTIAIQLPSNNSHLRLMPPAVNLAMILPPPLPCGSPTANQTLTCRQINILQNHYDIIHTKSSWMKILDVIWGLMFWGKLFWMFAFFFCLNCVMFSIIVKLISLP